MIRQILCTSLLLASLLIAQLTHAEEKFMFDGAPKNNGLPGEWQIRPYAGKPSFKLENESLHFKTNKASYWIYHPAERDLSKNPFIEWQWKALSLPVKGDMRTPGTDDQGLQILVTFSNKKTINYCWDSHAPVGTIVDGSKNFLLMKYIIKLISIESGMANLNKTMVVRRNLIKDYKLIYNEEPPKHIKVVGFQTNTQHTGGFAEGILDYIQLGQ